jgi:hypothetical protein
VDTAQNYINIAVLLKSTRMSNLTSVNEALRICQQEAKPKISRVVGCRLLVFSEFWQVCRFSDYISNMLLIATD